MSSQAVTLLNLNIQNMTVTRCGPIATFTLKILAASCSVIKVSTYRATLYCPGYYRFQNANYPISNKNFCSCVCVAAKQLMIACTEFTVLTYLVTPWSRVLLEKLTGSEASHEIPRLFGTRRFLTVFTSARHLSLS